MICNPMGNISQKECSLIGLFFPVLKFEIVAIIHFYLYFR